MQEHSLGGASEGDGGANPEAEPKKGSGRKRGGTRQRKRQARSGGAKQPDTPTQGGVLTPKRPTVRVQLHLDVDTVQRLGVHATLLQRDKSHEANWILRSYLIHKGQGRDLPAFQLTTDNGEEEGGEKPETAVPDTGEDRQDGAAA